MQLTRPGAPGLSTTRSLLNNLIELPELAATIQSLPAPTFAALVRKIGVEDAGELVALATTEQLVRAFDEDLFVNDRAGEREALDVGRFLVWLEVLLEAGDEVAAARVAELDEDFVAHALSGVVLVLDEDALRERLDEADEDAARHVDKTLESALTEDLDGYLLIAQRHDGWDAVLSLVLALDRNHRALLERLLERLARVGSRSLEDLEELSTVLSEGESLAEDAEAAREDRRSKQGFVEAQAARAFLSLARTPLEAPPTERDLLTRAYFREVERTPSRAATVPALHALPPAVLRELDELRPESSPLVLGEGATTQDTTLARFVQALRELGKSEPALLGHRMEEFAYLANVLLAGHERGGTRLRPREAADAVLATVCFGASLEARLLPRSARKKKAPTTAELVEVLRARGADLLFRLASSTLAQGKGPSSCGLLFSSEGLEAALARE